MASLALWQRVTLVVMTTVVLVRYRDRYSAIIQMVEGKQCTQVQQPSLSRLLQHKPPTQQPRAPSFTTHLLWIFISFDDLRSLNRQINYWFKVPAIVRASLRSLVNFLLIFVWENASDSPSLVVTWEPSSPPTLPPSIRWGVSKGQV